MNSSNFDWSQFEEVPQSSEGFDWNQFEPEDSSSALTKTAPPISSEKLKRNILRTGATAGSVIAGLPGDITSFVGKGLNFVADKFGKGKTEEELKEIVDNPFTSSNIRRKIEEHFPDLSPKNQEEKEWDDALGLITSFLTPIPGSSAAKAIDPRTKTQLYRFGRMAGLTEKEMTPLIQGNAKAGLLGKIAAKTKSLRDTLKITGNKLGKAYENLETQASSLPSLSKSASQSLANHYKKIVKSWENTLAKSPDTEAAINFTNKAIGTLENVGANPSSIINFTGEIEKAVNWNAMKNGKKMLTALKEPAKDLLDKEQPYIGKALRNLDSLYGKMKSFEKAVGIKNIDKFKEHSKATEKLVELAFKYGPYAALGTLTGVGALKSAAIGYGASHAATQLLTNPKLQNLHGKILSAIKNGSYKVAPKLIQAWERLTGKDIDEALKEEDEQD